MPYKPKTISLNDKLRFGKYKGRALIWVIHNDLEYANWMYWDYAKITFDSQARDYLRQKSSEAL